MGFIAHSAEMGDVADLEQRTRDCCSLGALGLTTHVAHVRSLDKLTGEGGRQIISLHMASEFLDLQNMFLGVADTSVQTLTEAEVALIPYSALEELALTRKALARALWIDTLIDSSIFREWVVNVGRRDSRARTGR